MDLLASELLIHERIEHEIFYPAAMAVTDDIPIAMAEHRQLSDQLAIVEELDPATAEYMSDSVDPMTRPVNVDALRP